MVYYFHQRGYFPRWYKYDSVEWWMIQPFKHFYRHIKTYQEIRINSKIDEEANEYGYRHTRGNRKRHTIDAWNDFGISCIDSKSWKKHYKINKQYEKPKIKNKFIVVEN